MHSSVLASPSEISGQKRKKWDKAAGQRMAATEIAAAAFAASLAILVSAVGPALAAPPTNHNEVDVVNPATNPALTSSVDDPGRKAYESSVSCVDLGIACEAKFPTVPQGHRLVIQHISAGLLFVGVPQVVEVVSVGSPNQGFSGFFVPPSANLDNILFDQAVLQYFEEGSTPAVQITGVGVRFQEGTQPVAMTGYLLTCNAATPCAPIAP